MTHAKTRLNKHFYLMLFAIGIASFMVHELAHWAMGVSLGHQMMASPNHVWATDTLNATHEMLISAAGPAITIVIGLVGFMLVRQQASLLGFGMLYMAFFSRLLAGAVSYFNPNDEARISTALGLGLWSLPLAVIGTLFVLTYVASRRLKLTIRDQFFCYVTASVVISLVVGIDHFFFSKA